MKMESMNAMRLTSSTQCEIHRTDPHVDSKKMCVITVVQFIINAHPLLSDCVQA